MVSVFDIEKLHDLLKDFYELTQIRITVFDENLQELVSYPASVAPYCQVIRGSVPGFEACKRCDLDACAAAKRRKTTYIYKCHAGLTEAVTPLYVGDVLAGYLLFGHVFPYETHQQGWEVIRDACEDLPINESMLKDALFDAPIIDEHYVESASHILHAVASYLVLERMATLKEDQLAVRLDSFLNAHFTEPLSAVTICHSLGIGKTQLYKIAGQLYGCGVSEHIRAMRIQKAQDLLAEQENISVAEVAAQCGFSDYNYFISVFSKDVGTSPGAYRKKAKE